MRKKIKQLMNKEEGFTLVELLAVIVILGIIVAIAIPSIGSLIDNAGDDATAAEETLIIDAARLWEIKDGNTIPAATTGAGSALTVQTLITDGFLEMRDSTTASTTGIFRDTATNNAITVGD